MKSKVGKSPKLFYFQVRESPAPRNISIPTPASDRMFGPIPSMRCSVIGGVLEPCLTQKGYSVRIQLFLYIDDLKDVNWRDAFVDVRESSNKKSTNPSDGS